MKLPPNDSMKLCIYAARSEAHPQKGGLGGRDAACRALRCGEVTPELRCDAARSCLHTLEKK
jgi:hypothetical protein